MFGQKTENALSDWPKTEITDDGAGVHITGKYVYPALGGIVTGIVGLGSLALGFWLAGRDNGSLLHWIGYVGGCLVAGLFVAGPLLGRLLQRNLDIRIFPGVIEVKGRLGRKRYSLNEAIEFRYEQHQKAKNEARKEQRTGKPQGHTYRDALEVLMQYGERRIVIAEMEDGQMEKAQALVFRLQTWCNKLQGMPTLGGTGRIVPADDAAVGHFGSAPDIR